MARERPEKAFHNLAHHMDLDWLREAHRLTRKSGATGVDGQTAQVYAERLEDNLRSLHERMKTGRYFAPPVRRVRIPKGNGETRPLGIPTFEDKIAQRAVAMLLESVYEQDFLDCSYGFRPGRSAHMALQALWKIVMHMGGGWLLEVDIRKFFDTLEHHHLRDIVALRVPDRGVQRMVGKWLNAGILEDGALTRPEEGTPQGGVISPLLANIYLHEVLDRWFHDVVKPRLRGAAHLIRYADDFVIVFEHEADARRVLEVLPKRFEKYGLQIHPEKTRLVNFRPPVDEANRGTPGDELGSFDLLGFRHIWVRSRKGSWVVRQNTAPSRLARALKAVAEWCRRHRNVPLPVQRNALAAKIKGHCSYYGITGNSEALHRFRQALLRTWKKWLSRRSQRAYLSWERFYEILKKFPLPPAIAVHSRLRVAPA